MDGVVDKYDLTVNDKVINILHPFNIQPEVIILIIIISIAMRREGRSNMNSLEISGQRSTQ